MSYNVQPVHHLNDTIGRLFLFRGPVMNAKPTNFEVWEAAIVAASAATRKPVAPVLACIDSFKGGTIIPLLPGHRTTPTTTTSRSRGVASPTRGTGSPHGLPDAPPTKKPVDEAQA